MKKRIPLKEGDVVICIDKKPLKSDNTMKFVNMLTIGEVNLVAGDEWNYGSREKAVLIQRKEPDTLFLYAHHVDNFVKIGKL